MGDDDVAARNDDLAAAIRDDGSELIRAMVAWGWPAGRGCLAMLDAIRRGLNVSHFSVTDRELAAFDQMLFHLRDQFDDVVDERGRRILAGEPT